MTKNPWGIEANHVGHEAMLEKEMVLTAAVKEAIDKLELAQHYTSTSPHTRLLAWEALHILRKAIRGEK
jgi:hypothetical protein